MSDLLANKIAAGEVVERPASVVKELVENALDAGTKEIQIDLQQGGIESIRVADNGSGMDTEDVPLAFERHATSKIHDDKDLFRITSLGFRGEALPSIAAVAKVELKTRQDGAVAGTFLRIEGGRILESGPTAVSKGTEIIVRDLFFNTPARLKYLKSIQTELGHTIDYVEKMALARHDVAFRLSHNERILVQTPGDGKLLHAIAAIYGREISRQMVPVEWEDYDYRITGMTCFPELNRANRNHVTFFVNGRYIRSYSLFNAVQAAYHTLLPINRYPVSVLQIHLDPSLVDCNVHPGKLEVRFSEEKDLFQRVQTAIRSALEKQTFIPKAFPSQSFERNEKRFVQQSKQPELQFDHLAAPTNEGRSAAISRNLNQHIRENGTDPNGKWITDRRQEHSPPADRASVEAALDIYRPHPKLTDEPIRLDTPTDHGESRSHQTDGINAANGVVDKRIPHFRPVAQVLGMYIVAEDENGLYLIDQHAAHEKVLYEKFSKKFAAKTVYPLPLLVPFTLDLSAAEAEKLERHLPLLQSFQLELERFGGGTYIVRSVPDIWGGLDTQRLISELIDEILAEAPLKDPLGLIEDKIISKSCKSAIKANQWLSMPEMIALCDQLAALDNPFTCPHGRPIIIHMTRYDLEKQFKRVM